MSQHRQLYNSAAWRKARLAQLRAEPLCRMHAELGQTVAAGVVDHIKAHRGDLELFLDRNNLQSLCKPCHDAHKQAQEHNAGGILRGAGLTGVPLDLAHPWHQGRGGQKSGAPEHKTGLFLRARMCEMEGGGVFDSSFLKNDLGCETVQPDIALVSAARARRQASTAKKLKAVQHARFAESASQLASLLPATFNDGESWHVLSNGGDHAARSTKSACSPMCLIRQHRRTSHDSSYSRQSLGAHP